MFCPNENARMHQVAVPSHYGQQVTVDQCRSCGGIWFDAFELFKVKQGEAHELEALDSSSLRAPSDIDNPRLLCPRDQTALVQYDDPNFPKGLVLTRCPECQGFWLNRGAFTQYQEVRQELMRPKENTAEDQKLAEDVKRLLASDSDSGRTEMIGNLGAYLSSPAHKFGMSPHGSSKGFVDEGKPANAILNVLLGLLRLFIFRH